jgi:predicted Rossmann fold flavoprotein
VLDVSRYLIAARHEDRAARLAVSWLPGEDAAAVDRALLAGGAAGAARWLRDRGLSQRLAQALCEAAGVDPARPLRDLPREARRALVRVATEWELPVVGDRGFTHAEVTAGGVPLAEIRLETMESRTSPGAYLVGEICDVDGRIGGFNFQWAWASGYVAGTAAGLAIADVA